MTRTFTPIQPDPAMLQRHGWGPPVSTPSRRWPDERFDDSLPGSHPCPLVVLLHPLN